MSATIESKSDVPSGWKTIAALPELLSPSSASSELSAFYIFPPGVKGSISGLFATHPPMEKRIEALQRLEAQLQGRA